jgi:hypothetical protein
LERSFERGTEAIQKEYSSTTVIPGTIPIVYSTPPPSPITTITP